MTTLSTVSQAAKAAIFAKFPVKFPVSRENKQSKVLTALGRQPARLFFCAHATRLRGSDPAFFAGVISLSPSLAQPVGGLAVGRGLQGLIRRVRKGDPRCSQIVSAALWAAEKSRLAPKARGLVNTVYAVSP
jgi:hypothetical protein